MTEGFWLSIHADQRLYERSFFNEKSLKKLMESNSFFHLGVESEKNNISHCLVYEKTNNHYFVAIIDNQKNLIITLLPIEYHAKFENRLIKEYISIDKEIKRRAKLAANSRLGFNDLKLKIKIVAIEVIEGKKFKNVIKSTSFNLKYYEKLKHSNRKAINIFEKWKAKNKDKDIISAYISTGRESEKIFFFNQNK